MLDSSPGPSPSVVPDIGVDLRALVPTLTGIGVYTRSLLLQLAARGGMRYRGLAHKPVRGADELRAAGIETEHEPMPLIPLGVLWQQLKLPKRLHRGDIDLFWSPLNTLPLRCPVPAVVTVHDLTALLMPEHHRLKVRWSLLPFLRPTLERADRIVAVSQATARDIAFHFPQAAAKVRVVYSGVDPEFVPGTREGIEATRAELGAPDGYLLYAGTVEPRKNVASILDAWETLRADDPHLLPLVLVGPYGWGSEDLMRRIERLAPLGVRVLGHVDRERLVRLFQAATTFVYPSLYEGFGLPPAEALACGIPTIVSTSSSLPEVVGKAGLQVEASDPGELAAAIQKLLESPARREELRGRSLERAARFRWDRAAAEMEGIFAEAMG
jgi:glycosyltransferase involved in cell wall biosynthesis